MSTVAPSDPSSRSAWEVLCTVSSLNRSEEKILKSKERVRLTPPSLSGPPVVVSVSMPLISTRVNCGPRPRTVISRPSPSSRVIATPGMRCSDSARFWSGNLPMSSARMVSASEAMFSLIFSACSRLVRYPVTTTSCNCVGDAAASDAAGPAVAWGSGAAASELAPAAWLGAWAFAAAAA